MAAVIPRCRPRAPPSRWDSARKPTLIVLGAAAVIALLVARRDPPARVQRRRPRVSRPPRAAAAAPPVLVLHSGRNYTKADLGQRGCWLPRGRVRRWLRRRRGLQPQQRPRRGSPAAAAAAAAAGPAAAASVRASRPKRAAPAARLGSAPADRGQRRRGPAAPTAEPPPRRRPRTSLAPLRAPGAAVPASSSCCRTPRRPLVIDFAHVRGQAGRHRSLPGLRPTRPSSR